MTPDVIQGVKAFLTNRCSDLKFIDLSWFGGEPLMAKQVVFDISAHVVELARRNKDLNYSAGMSTNGYSLDILTLARLLSVGVSRFQISLDGAGEVHDTTRRHIAGKPTFKKIWDNLIAMRNSDFSFDVVLRIHVHSKNVPAVYELIEMANFAFSKDPRFSVFVKPIEKLGGGNDGVLRLESSQKNDIVPRLLAAVDPQLKKPNDDAMCYAAKANSLVIRANGDLARPIRESAVVESD
jgi:uncharacterized protein